MTTQTETNSSIQTRSRWQNLKRWLLALAEAVDYDPQSRTDEAIRQLREEVANLARTTQSQNKTMTYAIPKHPAHPVASDGR